MTTEGLITHSEHILMKVPIEAHLRRYKSREIGYREIGYMAPIYQAAPRIRFVQTQIDRLTKELRKELRKETTR